LIEYLRDRDEACPVCLYNLRDLQTDRCPECGMFLVLRVVAVEPFLTFWICATASVCAVASMAMFFVATGLAHPGELHDFFDFRHFPIRAAALSLFLAQIPLGLFLLLRHERFTGLNRPLQKALSIIACTIDAVAFILLTHSFIY
jgi:hypothetical protein